MEEERATAERYAQICREINPVVAQVSGGEPTLRRDLGRIISALRVPGKPPYIVLTTNGALLTKNKYRELRRAGVDEFSLSFDYPDERHDDFRGIPGLFSKIKSLMTGLRSEKNKGITLSGVVQRKNFRDLIKMADLAKEWEVKLNFSTYTWLRTQKKEFMIPEDEIPELEAVIQRLKEHKRKHGVVIASDFVFKQMINFFKNQAIDGCRAGERFFVVNPDGTLSPCGLIIKNHRSQKEIIENFSRHNTCGMCYTSIRANTEKPVKYLILDSLRAI